jgi:hypothetical protein
VKLCETCNGASFKMMVRGLTVVIMLRRHPVDLTQFRYLFSSVFALVTVSGSLIVYSMHVSSRAMVKIAAHTGDATSLDWHPTKPYVIATGGAGDRCVKGESLHRSATECSNRCYSTTRIII